MKMSRVEEVKEITCHWISIIHVYMRRIRLQTIFQQFPVIIKNKKNFKLMRKRWLIIMLEVRHSWWMLQLFKILIWWFLKKMTFRKLSIHTEIAKKTSCTRKHRTLIIETLFQLINVNQWEDERKTLCCARYEFICICDFYI